MKEAEGPGALATHLFSVLVADILSVCESWKVKESPDIFEGTRKGIASITKPASLDFHSRAHIPWQTWQHPASLLALARRLRASKVGLG